MGKRIPPIGTAQPQKKTRTVLSVPSVNAMSGFTSGSSDTRASTDDDKLYIAIMKYNGDGSLYNGLFDKGPLYVMQLKTNAYPSPLFKLKTMLGLHWKEETTKALELAQAEGKNHLPDFEEKNPLASFTDFETEFRTLFIWSPKKEDDVDGIGFQPHRCGFYFSGGMEQAKNLIMHLDNVWEVSCYTLYRCQ